MRIGFLMDPLETVRTNHDTTFALMLECQRRGLEVRVFEQQHLFFGGDRAHARMRTVTELRRGVPHFHLERSADAPLSELDVLFLRKDPPVDREFWQATQMVGLNPGPRPVLLNEPEGLRAANEKLFGLRFADLMPPTVVSRDMARLRAFVDEQGGDVVVKPVDGFGGQGVFRLRAGDPNFNSLLETVTSGGRVAAVAQRYLPESRTGDKRVIVLDGEPIGALLRVPAATDARANMAVGGRAEAGEIGPREREICARLAPDLRRLGLHLVGLDVIGTWLTEVNVTSPTGVVEIEALSGLKLSEQIVEYALGLAARREERRSAPRAGPQG